jgi:hypothetical protein
LARALWWNIDNLLGSVVNQIIVVLAYRIEEFYKHDKGIAIPIYRSRRGQSIIFAIKYKPELLALEGDIVEGD